MWRLQSLLRLRSGFLLLWLLRAQHHCSAVPSMSSGNTVHGVTRSECQCCAGTTAPTWWTHGVRCVSATCGVTWQSAAALALLKAPIIVLVELALCCMEEACSLSEPDLSAVPQDLLHEVHRRLLRVSPALLGVFPGAAARGVLCAAQVLYNKLCYQPTGKGKLLKLQTTGSP